MSGLMKTEKLNAFVKTLKGTPGVTVAEDKEAGTVVCKEGAVEVLRGIQKGRGGPWIVTTNDGEQVKWK